MPSQVSMPILEYSSGSLSVQKQTWEYQSATGDQTPMFISVGAAHAFKTSVTGFPKYSSSLDSV